MNELGIGSKSVIPLRSNIIYSRLTTTQGATICFPLLYTEVCPLTQSVVEPIWGKETVVWYVESQEVMSQLMMRTTNLSIIA